MTKVTIHLPRHQLERGDPDPRGFYGRLRAELSVRGHDVQLAERHAITASRAYDAPGAHIVHQGLVQQQRVLNTAIAYLTPFWYVDPLGIYGDSSLFAARFQPDCIDIAQAAPFFARLRDRWVGRRMSRRDQPVAVQRFAPGAIAVFLQGPSLPVQRAQHMSETEMVLSILRGSQGRRVLVKPHPMNADFQTLSDLNALAPDWPNLELVDANVHDMLAGAVLCCSVGSSVSFEAMLHRVPVMCFGKTDFHHCAVTVQTPDAFESCFAEALARAWPVEAFLLWFLQRGMINMGRDDWYGRIAARMGSDFADK